MGKPVAGGGGVKKDAPTFTVFVDGSPENDGAKALVAGRATKIPSSSSLVTVVEESDSDGSVTHGATLSKSAQWVTFESGGVFDHLPDS